MKKNRPKRGNILKMSVRENLDKNLELLRLGYDEKEFLVFTPLIQSCEVHYCEETEIRGYLHCNGADCCLCKIGKKPKTMFLMPVFCFDDESVKVIQINDSQRPHALFPQMRNILEGGLPIIFIASRIKTDKFIVSTRELEELFSTEIEKPIKNFKAEWKKGVVDLTSVYPRIGNSQLIKIPEIRQKLKLRGLLNSDDE